ncbi:MAG: flagellar protein FliS [Gemmatimonadetes bacterium]|nr:flagellar protein FliS [Gemmatimonadota bacterium]
MSQPGMMTNKYRETEILSAAPERLLIITFDGLIAAMTRARVAAAASRSDVLFPALEKSRDILGELLASLDFNRGGAIARQLSSIYVFQLGQLQTMGMTPDVRMLERLTAQIRELRDAFAEIAARVPQMEVA